MTLPALVRALVCAAVLAACSSDESAPTQVPPAPPPPPPPPGAPPPVVVTNAPGDPNVAANPFAALKALGAAAEQMAQGSAAQGGPVVNWRDLAPFAPDELAGFKAQGELEGSTTQVPGMGNMQVSRISRRYQAGDETMQLEIVDTSLAPMLRAPFALVAMVQEDSSSGYKKGTTVQGHPAIAEFANRGSSELHLLAGQRFLVNVEVDTKTPGVAERVGNALRLSDLVQLGAKATGDSMRPGAPAPTSP